MAFFLVMTIPALLGGVLTVDRRRLVYFSVFALLALASQFQALTFSVLSIGLLLILHAMLTLSWKATWSEYAKVCAVFSALMLAPAIFVFVQYAYELTHGLGNSLSLERLIPNSFLLHGYFYEASIPAWIVWNRPNGLVFLEPSFCSAFLACAVLNEIYILRRYLWATFFFAALVATDGGTGQLMIGIGVPVIGLIRRPGVTIAIGIFALVAVVAVGVASSHLPLLSRLSELNQENSSGYSRLLLPLQAIVAVAPDPAFLFFGKGAGASTISNPVAWPITKLGFEYGTLTTLAYLAFISSCMWGKHNLPLRVSVFVIFQFTGGYLLTPVFINFVFLTCMGRIVYPAANPRVSREPGGDTGLVGTGQRLSVERENKVVS
jgi:hypothetical protein